MQSKADEASAPEPYVIEVGESEYAKAERLRKERDEAKRKKEAEEAKERVISNDNRIRSTNGGLTNNAGRDNLSNSADVYVKFEATAYTAFCNTGCTGITKTGLDVSNTTQHGGRTIIAVDPAVIPLGSKVSIRLADGRVIEAVAEDVGGDIKGKRIDLLVSGSEEAVRFGRQKVEVRVGDD